MQEIANILKISKSIKLLEKTKNGSFYFAEKTKQTLANPVFQIKLHISVHFFPILKHIYPLQYLSMSRVFIEVKFMYSEYTNLKLSFSEF